MCYSVSKVMSILPVRCVRCVLLILSWQFWPVKVKQNFNIVTKQGFSNLANLHLERAQINIFILELLIKMKMRMIKVKKFRLFSSFDSKKNIPWNLYYNIQYMINIFFYININTILFLNSL